MERLAGVSAAAASYSWIFTSLLSSDMLVQVSPSSCSSSSSSSSSSYSWLPPQVEQLLARTRVLSIFPVSNRRLLRATVKMKDNAAQVGELITGLLDLALAILQTKLYHHDFIA